MSYLGAFGISPEEALQIWKVWGDAAVEMIRMDPYVLCREPVSIDLSGWMRLLPLWNGRTMKGGGFGRESPMCCCTT